MLYVGTKQDNFILSGNNVCKIGAYYLIADDIYVSVQDDVGGVVLIWVPIPESILGQEQIFFFDICQQILYQNVYVSNVLTFVPSIHTGPIYDTKFVYYLVNGNFTNCIRELQFKTINQQYVYNIASNYYSLQLLTQFVNISISSLLSDITNFNGVRPCDSIVPIPVSNGMPLTFVYTLLQNNFLTTVNVILTPSSIEKEATPFLSVGETLNFAFFRPFRRAAVLGGSTDIHIYTESQIVVGPAGKGVSFNPPRWTSNFTGTVNVTFTFVFVTTNDGLGPNPFWRYRIGMRNTGGTQVQTDLFENRFIPGTEHIISIKFLYNVQLNQFIEFGDYFATGTPNIDGARYQGTGNITIVRMS